MVEQPNLKRLRRYRLDRVREQLIRRDYAGALLADPLNTRYATDSTNMQVWCTHNAVRYVFVATQGPVVLFDFHGGAHLSEGLGTIDEVRPATSWFYFTVGPRVAERAGVWADEVADLINIYGSGNRRLAVDRCDPVGTHALLARGISIQDGQEVMELARSIKSPDEIAAMRCAIAACQAGMGSMRKALRPGITENELWSVLHAENIARGGEWIETRLLASGPRTNPWFHECSGRVIEKGDLVSFDTDLIGPYGYCADISRCWLCGDGKPTEQQRRLYALAREQIEYNTELVKPGLSFREFSDRAWRLPESCAGNRYSVISHGVGLCDEYPAIYYPQEHIASGYDGVIDEYMTLCVESYIGEVGGSEGVKLEQQLLVNANGTIPLSTFPFEDELFL
ncbi:MAG: Xaa-Pro peptidase family protein [Gammaproteobacteria bacterium]|nr:Xaa-Pro peptidase family protein [Gammaproteobacteria bacterium]